MRKSYLGNMMLVLLLIGVMLITASAILAGSGQYSSTNAGGPQWVRPFADGSCCSGLGPVRYHSMEFYVDTAGSYNVSSVQNGWDGYLFVYASPFDPSNPTVNFLAGNDDGGGGIGTSDITGIALSANTTYIVVTTGFANGDEGTFTNTITGPGGVFLGPYGVAATGGTCLLDVPAGSVVGDTPFQTQVYYEPGNVSPGVVLNPGTYIVIGQDESETYYKIMLSCQFVWVRKENMQPSYEPPQNGAPLPTRIVN